MAIAYQTSSSTSIAASATCVITKPTGLAVGDVMVAFVGGLANAAATYTAPAGWTAIQGQSNGAESCRAFYKVADSSDVSAPNFTFNGDGDYIGGGMVRIDGQAALYSNSSTQIETSGVFGSADLTPDAANSLLLFMAMYVSSSSDLDSYACATSNPTWTEVFDMHTTAPGTDFGLAMAYASRPEITSTGDFSCADNGQVMGIFMSLAPIVNASTTAGVITMTASVPAPSVSGTGSVSAGTATLTLSVPTPTASLVIPVWLNDDKTSEGTTTNQDKS